MIAIDDSRLHEWAEFNLPAELLERSMVLSPLARRVLAAPLAQGERRDGERGQPPAAPSPISVRCCCPGSGFNTLPKP